MTSTSFDPISYIQGIVSATTPANNNSAATSTTSQAGSTSGNNSSSNTGSATSSSNLLGLNPTVLSLLQGSSSSSSAGSLSSLLDSNAVPSTEPLSGLYDALLYNASTAAPLTTAVADTQAQQTQTQTQQANPVENVLNSYTTAINAYNQTLLQNAQSVAAQNDYGPDGTTLIS